MSEALRSQMAGGLSVLMDLAPDDVNIQHLQYALASSDTSLTARRNALVEMLEGATRVLHPVAGWLRADRDAKVRASAWAHTESGPDEARRALARERTGAVRAAIATHATGLPATERAAALVPFTNFSAAAVAAGRAVFEPDFVIAALQFLWDQPMPELRPAELKSFTDAVTDPQIAAVVVDLMGAPAHVHLRAATALPPKEAAAVLGRVADRVRECVPRSAAFDISHARAKFVGEGLRDFGMGPELTPQAAVDLIAINDAIPFSGALPQEVARAARDLPARRVTNYDTERAVRYIESLEDPEERVAAAWAALLSSPDREWDYFEEGTDLFDVISPYLPDASEATVAAMAKVTPRFRPASWMLRFPLVFDVVAAERPGGCLSWLALAEDTEHAAALRDRLVRVFLSEDSNWNSSVANTLLSRGWMRQEDLMRVPLTRALSVLCTVTVGVLKNNDVTAPQVRAALASLVGATPGDTSVNLASLLAVNDDAVPFEDLMALVSAVLGTSPA